MTQHVPVRVGTYGRWGNVAHDTFLTIAHRLSVRTKLSFSVALSSIYTTLTLVLVRQNSRAILARLCHHDSVRLGSREVRQLASSSS